MQNLNTNSGSSAYHFARIVLCTAPAARADVRGDKNHSGLKGTVSFYPAGGGALVVAEVEGLPLNSKTGIFAMHIHEGRSCTGNAADPFADTGGHYNPKNQPHPLHAGDLPPLFSNGGFGYYSFFTARFSPAEIIGRTVVIHSGTDDFKTQPAGDSGSKIACGVIEKT